MTDVATEYLTSWTGIEWTLAAVALLVTVPSLLFAGLAVGAASERPYDADNSQGPALAGWWLLMVAAVASSAVLPGVMMRHFPTTALSGLLAVVLVIAAVVLAYVGSRVNDRRDGGPSINGWWLYTPAIVLAVGTVLGLVYDAISRVAASIPMAVGTLIALIALVAFLVVPKGRR